MCKVANGFFGQPVLIERHDGLPMIIDEKRRYKVKALYRNAFAGDGVALAVARARNGIACPIPSDGKHICTICEPQRELIGAWRGIHRCVVPRIVIPNIKWWR